eukprot:161908_1
MAADDTSIHVTNLIGQKLALTINPNDVLLNVKQEIHDKYGVPVEMQKIKLNGKSLSNSTELSDLDVNSSSNLLLVLTMKGGALAQYCGPCCAPCQAHDIDDYARIRSYYDHDCCCCCQSCTCMKNWCCMIAFDRICNYPSHKQDTIPAAICLFIASIICFPISIAYCIYAWCQKLQIQNKQTLPIEIIHNWSEYERMLNNISWPEIITMESAQRINSTSHLEYYNLFNFIFDKTDNTPSRIRNFQQLVDILNKHQKFLLITFCDQIDENAPLLPGNYRIHKFNSILAWIIGFGLWIGVDIALSVMGFRNLSVCKNEGIFMGIDMFAEYIGLGCVGVAVVCVLALCRCKKIVSGEDQLETFQILLNNLTIILLYVFLSCVYSAGVIIAIIDSMHISSECKESSLWKTVVVWCVIRGLIGFTGLLMIIGILLWIIGILLLKLFCCIVDIIDE